MIKRIWQRVKPWSIPVCLALFCFVLLQYVILIGYVPTSSMEPTLKEKSFLFALRIFQDPEVGDIIVFEKGDVLQVKRIAFASGEKVDLSQLEYMASQPIPQRNSSVITVPEDCYFVLGDNTQSSLDSRYWQDPFIKKKQIVAVLLQFKVGAD